jgi:probable rRNA maturation factor
MKYEIDISSRQQVMAVDMAKLRQSISRALEIEGVAAAVLSISIVDDVTIHVINRDHLQHDYPTDVISFQLDFGQPEFDADESDLKTDPGDGDTSYDADASEVVEAPDDSAASDSVDVTASESAAVDDADFLRADGCFIEGEIVASAETAQRMAASGNWSADEELTLYVIHGLLHICGYDDLTPDERRMMRVREQVLMEALGHRLQRPVDTD